VLITTSLRLAKRVAGEIARQMPASGPARQSIARHGGIIVCRSMNDAIALANDAAAEHVVAGSESIARRVVNAGAVFVGAWTAQVGGRLRDWIESRPSDCGAARYRGGLNAADFVKLVSVQRMTQRGLKSIGKTVTTLARAEGLEAHARSIEVRQR
jgi:histidinol dehydrogenase